MPLPPALLIHTASVYRPTEHVEVSGGLRAAEALAGTSVPCRLIEGPPSDVRGGTTEWGNATGVVYLNTGADVARHDVLIINDDRHRVIGTARPSIRDFYLKAYVEYERRTETLP